MTLVFSPCSDTSLPRDWARVDIGPPVSCERPRSLPATAPITSPDAMPGSSSFFCCSVPSARMYVAALAVPNHGTGVSARPSSSAAIAASSSV